MASKKVGALWLKEKVNLDGTKFQYQSGQITIDNIVHNITVFGNTYKQNPKQPDYEIHLNQKD